MSMKQVCCFDVLISGSNQDQPNWSNNRTCELYSDVVFMMQIVGIIWPPVYVSEPLQVQYSSQESGTVVWKIY